MPYEHSEKVERLTHGVTVDHKPFLLLKRLIKNRNNLSITKNSGASRSKNKGLGLDFHQLREYSYGDDPRFIDWKSSSRLNGTYTKEFVEDKDNTCLIIIDLRKTMYFGSTKRLLSVLAYYSSVLLALKYSQMNYSISFRYFDGDTVLSINSLETEKKIRNAIHTLAKVHNKQQGTHNKEVPFLKNLELEKWNKFSKVILITNLLYLTEDILIQLNSKAKKIHKTVIALEDPIYYKIPEIDQLSDKKNTVLGSSVQSVSNWKSKIYSYRLANTKLLEVSTDMTIFDIAKKFNSL